MFKHTVNYTDFNGNEREDDLYFHLATHELTRLEAEIGVSLDIHIAELTKNNKSSELIAFLEKMILTSYGEKTSDGKSFYKTNEIRQAFEYSQAYAEMFEAVILDTKLAKKFGEQVADNGKNTKNKVAPKFTAVQEPNPTPAE